MTRVIKRKNLLLITALLAGCASPSKQSDLNKLHKQVGQLNSEMHQLTRQATALTQQNMLNTHSTQGAWLLPAATTPVLLDSQAGEIRLSLSPLISEGSNTQTMLHIRVSSQNPLPAFTLQVEWGELDPTTGKPLQADSQSQSIHVDKVLLPQSEITVPLMLRNTTPEQTGYLRIHDLVVLVASHP